MKVLLVEDEEDYIDALTIGLENEGFQVVVATDGAQALAMFDDVNPDVVLLDLMLPRVSGVEVCREIRTKSRVPILILTAKGSEIDTVVGLEVGADDYITKPYRMRELLARMAAVMRRSDEAQVKKETRPNNAIVVGDVVLDPDSYEVKIRDAVTTLPLKEFELLRYLMTNAGRVLSRYQLIEKVWGYDYYGDTKTLDVHIKRLRAKVEPVPSKPTRIVTMRGVGYKYESRDRLYDKDE